MRVNILTPVFAFSILLFAGCAEEKADPLMPVTTNSELALELYETGIKAFDQFKQKLAYENMYKAVELDPDFFMAYFLKHCMISIAGSRP